MPQEIMDFIIYLLKNDKIINVKETSLMFEN